jgi:hypothetical protein
MGRVPMLLCVLLAGLAGGVLLARAAKSSLTGWEGSGMNWARMMAPAETQDFASLRW